MEMTQYFPVSGDISKSGWLIFSIREVLDTAAARRESAQARNTWYLEWDTMNIDDIDDIHIFLYFFPIFI